MNGAQDIPEEQAGFAILRSIARILGRKKFYVRAARCYGGNLWQHVPSYRGHLSVADVRRARTFPTGARWRCACAAWIHPRCMRAREAALGESLSTTLETRLRTHPV